MFLNYNSGISYMQTGSVLPDSYDGLGYSSLPATECKSMSGVRLVAQYVESYRFKTNGICQIQDDQLRKVLDRAYELDEVAEENDYFDYSSENFPSANSVMQAFIDLKYVVNASGIGYVRPSRDDVKYFIRQYGGIILETKITSTTYNAYDYLIQSAGTVLYEDFTKGFIAFGYDPTNIYLQNSLGLAAGSLGFHAMPWTVADQLMVKGCVFRLDNPS